MQDTIAAPTVATTSVPANAEFFRLPHRGGDPIFGLSRSFYYQAERDGLLQMVRLRSRGKQRGVVLVAVSAVRDMIARRGVCGPVR